MLNLKVLVQSKKICITGEIFLINPWQITSEIVMRFCLNKTLMMVASVNFEKCSSECSCY